MTAECVCFLLLRICLYREYLVALKKECENIPFLWRAEAMDFVEFIVLFADCYFGNKWDGFPCISVN